MNWEKDRYNQIKEGDNVKVLKYNDICRGETCCRQEGYLDEGKIFIATKITTWKGFPGAHLNNGCTFPLYCLKKVPQ